MNMNVNNFSDSKKVNMTETLENTEESEVTVLEIPNEDDANEIYDQEYESIDITPEKTGGVMKQIIKPGEGNEYPGFGDRVSVHYTGWLLNGGEKPVEFDSNRKEDKSEFNLGRGLVIKGWDLGIATMKKGEIAIFIIQPSYHYGEMGNPPTIPPHTPLLFEVELYEWKLEDLSPKKDSGILRKVIEAGEGTDSPNDGSFVKVKLLGSFEDKVFEDTEKEFILGEGYSSNIPEGIELALFRFRLTEKSLIYLKSRYAFEKGSEELDIPPDADVQYEVTLLEFQKAKDIWEMNSDEKYERAKVCKEKGISFIQVGAYKVAVKQFKWILVCLEKEPGVDSDSKDERNALLLTGYLNMALCYLKLENYIDAIKVCDKVLAIDPKNEKALYRRGQAKMYINDYTEALEDLETLCRIYPDNKAASHSVKFCRVKHKEQKLKDKSIYNKMFEKFVKQDEEKLKSMKTETGVWQNEKRDKKEPHRNHNQRLYEQHNAVLRDANVIELSNTACL